MSTGAYNQPPMGLEWAPSNNYKGYGYFNISGSQVLSSLPVQSMPCSSGIEISSSIAPYAAFAKMHVNTQVTLYTEAITLSVWMHINSGEPQLSWNQMSRTSSNQLILPAAGSPNSCLFATTSTTCVLSGSTIPVS